MTTKRITISIDANVDSIRDFIAKETGIRMSYVQIFNYLIHFYIKHAQEPRTKWNSIEKVEK
jgi:hypothetical protein|tara:strand:- start:11240 stop:11425 length:186 start_codon:yes stop_codon:yes gene_type:complete